MPGYVPPARPTVLEGDYSDWTIHDSFDDAQVSFGWYFDYAVFNKAETVALLIHSAQPSVRKYDIATKTLGDIQTNCGLPGTLSQGDAEGTTKSVQATYVVGLIYAGSTYGNGIVIWKNGEVIKTMPASDLGLDTNKVMAVSISRSGKYVAVAGRRSASGNYGWVVLAGS